MEELVVDPMEDKINELRAYSEVDKALEAVGLSE